MTITHRNIEWRLFEDGEYNEHTANIAGHNCRVFSDRDGVKWEGMVDDEWLDTSCDSITEAMDMVMVEAYAQ